MRSFGFVVVTACCACATITACEDLGGLRGGDGDGGGASDAETRADSESDRDATLPGDGGSTTDADADAGACDLGPIADGLAVYFPFDEGGGVLAQDCGPSKLVAAISGAKTWGPGRRKTALVFDGSSTCLNVEDDPTAIYMAAFTMSAWVNVTAFPASANASIIIGRTVDSNEDGFRLAADQGSVFNLKVGVPGDAGFFRVVSGVQPTGTWRHVSAVYEPGVKGVLYVDGSAVDTDATNIPTIVIDANAVLRVGCGSAGNFFSGSIDEARIYARALSPVEIALLAAN